jgi:hypothetical protein
MKERREGQRQEGSREGRKERRKGERKKEEERKEGRREKERKAKKERKKGIKIGQGEESQVPPWTQGGELQNNSEVIEDNNTTLIRVTICARHRLCQHNLTDTSARQKDEVLL